MTKIDPLASARAIFSSAKKAASKAAAGLKFSPPVRVARREATTRAVTNAFTEPPSSTPEPEFTLPLSFVGGAPRPGSTTTFAQDEATIEIVSASQFDDGLDEILDRAEATEGHDARAEIAVEATEYVETQLAAYDDPEAVREALAESVDEFERLGTLLFELDERDGLPALSPGQTEEAIGHLTRATESVGVGDAALLTEPLARGMAAGEGLQQLGPFADLDYWQPLRSAISGAIENGDGTIFGASLAAALPEDGGTRVEERIRIEVSRATADGVETLQKKYDSAAAEYEALNREIAMRVFEFGDILPEGDLDAGVDALLALEENQEIIARYEAVSAELLTTVDGLSLVAEPDPDSSAAPEVKAADATLHDAATGVFEESSEIFSTDAGAELIADALEASGRGETTFVDLLKSVDGYRGKADKLSNALFRATAARAYLNVSSGDYAAAEDLFRGLQENGRLIGVNDPEKLEALTELLRQQGGPNALDPEDFAEVFAREVQKVKGRAGIDGDTRLAKAFDILGATVSAAELYRYADNFSEAELEDHFKAVLELSELSGDVSKFLDEGSSIASRLQTFGKLSRAGLIFDVINLSQQLREGDFAEGGIALAGLVGSILVSSSTVGPVGTAIGAVLSVGALIATPILGQIREGRAEDRAEARLGVFLEAAGFTPEEAELLRDVARGGHQSIGSVFSQIASFHPNLEPADIVDILLHPERHGGLDTDVTDQRRAAIDAIEALPRNANGSFTFDSVLEAARIIELATGVTLDPNGISGSEALAGLDSDFDFYDADGDGFVSFTELEDAAGGPDGYPSVPRDRRHDVARYLVRRPDLINRLDVADDSHGAGAFDQRISRGDVDVAVEQNHHLEVLYRRWDDFVAADGEDGRLVGVDSFDDNSFARIAAESNDPELRATAEYFQENFALRGALDNAGDWFTLDTFIQPEGAILHTPTQIYQYGGFGAHGDGQVSRRDILAAVLKLYVQ